MVTTVKNLKPLARRLRRDATGVEKKLWSRLRNRQLDGLKFRRQEPCEGYIADFLCENPRMIIELDGSHHSEEGDAARTRRLERAGYAVIRFSNGEVLSNLEGTLISISIAAKAVAHEQQRPSPCPLPEGEGL